MPFTIPKETFLYSVAAYGAVHALLFTLKPEIPTMDSFGEDAAKNNKPVKVMTAVMGSMFGVLATASFVLALGEFDAPSPDAADTPERLHTDPMPNGRTLPAASREDDQIGCPDWNARDAGPCTDFAGWRC